MDKYVGEDMNGIENVETVKIWDIPFKQVKMTHDGYMTDYRIFADENSESFSELDKEEYEKVDNQLGNYYISTPEYTTRISYDIRGYDYWMKEMQEPVMMTLSVHFNKGEDFPLDKVERLESDILKGIEFIQEISDEHPPIDRRLKDLEESKQSVAKRVNKLLGQYD